MTKFYGLIFIALLWALTPKAQETDCGGDRYKEKVFSEIEFIDNVIYARKQASDGTWMNLGYDVYMPAGDEVSARPAVMLAHGGAFIQIIDQKSPDIIKMSIDLAQRGYVVFSVHYREEPSVVSLIQEENMVKAVGRALIDIRDVTCHLMDTTILYGNPYRIDTENVFVGGVSAGAISFIMAVFLDSLSWLPQQYQDWILEVEPNTQALLDNKYCGAKVKGLVGVSGAILDTNWIRPEKVDEYPAIYNVHGTQDPVVPYGINHPFGLTALPKLMGTQRIHWRAQSIGLRSEVDIYPGAGHAPIFGINLPGLFNNQDPLDFMFNPTIMGNTLQHTADFLYSLLDCGDSNIPLATAQNAADRLVAYPNPSRGDFTIDIPADLLLGGCRFELLNNLGQVVEARDISPVESRVRVHGDFAAGLYHIRLYRDDQSGKIHTGQVVVGR